MKNKISFLLLLLVLVGCTKSTITFKELRENNDNAMISEKYFLPDFEYDMYLIGERDLTNLEEKKYSGIVIFSREDCPYCKDALDDIVTVINKNDNQLKIKEILILETDTLNNDQKAKITDKYGVTVVPTISVLINGELKENHIGILSEELLLKIFEGDSKRKIH